MIINPEIPYLLLSVPRRCMLAAVRFYRENGVDATKSYLLHEIAGNGGTGGFSTIIDNTYYSAGTISKQFKQLSDLGYVTCFADERGNHNKSASLTPMGYRYVQDSTLHYAEVEKYGLKGFTDNDREIFSQLLRRVNELLAPNDLPPADSSSAYPVILSYFFHIVRMLERTALQIKGRRELVSGPEKQILITLYYSDCPCNFKKLERITLISQAHIVRSLQNLERLGFVVSKEDPHDKRANIVELTPSGAKLGQDYSKIFESTQSKLTQEMTEEELDKLHHYLVSFERNILLEFGE